MSQDCGCRYALVHAGTGAILEMFSVGRASGPCMVTLSKNELLVSKDNVAVIVGPDGRTTRKVLSKSNVIHHQAHDQPAWMIWQMHVDMTSCWCVHAGRHHME